MLDERKEGELVQKVLSGLKRAQEKRKKTNLDNMVPYWREMAGTFDSQWFDMDAARKHGTLKAIDSDGPEFNVSINYINQELLNMVASDLLSPLNYRVLFKFFHPKHPLDVQIPGLTSSDTPMSPDQYTDRIKNIIDFYISPEKLNLDDARMRLYEARYTDGMSYLGLDWDGDAGDIARLPKQKMVGQDGTETWDVVAGMWSEDGQYFQIPNGPAVPRETFDLGEEYREDFIAVGEPRLSIYDIFQVYWDVRPGPISRHIVNGVYIVDWITKAQAQRDYKTQNHYGESTEIAWEKLDFSGWLAGIADKIKQVIGINTEKDDSVLRVRFRRRPDALAGEQRSIWMTIVGNRLVRIGECPYGKSFDTSLGIYPFMARPNRNSLEGIPDIAFMMGSQKVANSIDSLILEHIEQLPFGAYQTIGSESPDVNLTTGAGPRVITTNQPMTQLQLPALSQEVFTQKADMRYIIQYFGRANQLAVGNRSQDANTAYQASVQQAYGAKMTSFNQFNDALAWSLFFNDLKTLLADPNLVRELRTIRQMQIREGMAFMMDFQVDSTIFKYVDSIEVRPDDLRGKSEDEEKADIMALMSIANPADPAEAEFIKALKKRYVELTNLKGITYDAQAVIMPGIPQPGQAIMPAKPQQPAPQGSTEAHKAALQAIAEGE